MVSRDVVLAVFVLSISIALFLSFYSEIKEAYGTPVEKNIVAHELNETEEFKLINKSIIIIKYYYRQDDDVSRELTPHIMSIAAHMNQTIFLEKLNNREVSNKAKKVPTFSIVSKNYKETIEKPETIGPVIKAIFEAHKRLENADNISS